MTTPLGWDTPNSFTFLAGVLVVESSEDAYSGDYSALLETKTVFGPNISPGLITLGDFEVDITTGDASFTGGIPLTDHVINLTGYYKYAGAEGDSAEIFAMSFSHPEGEDVDTVAVGNGFLHDAADWTMFTIPIYKLNSTPPDSFNIIILSSGEELHPGSKLYVDDVSVETITGVIDLFGETEQVKVYPNPVSDYVKFEVPEANSEMELLVFDNTGRLLKKAAFNSKTIELNLTSMPDGLYTYKISNTNALIGSGSFIRK